jgi:hypothetical protein
MLHFGYFHKSIIERDLRNFMPSIPIWPAKILLHVNCPGMPNAVIVYS